MRFCVCACVCVWVGAYENADIHTLAQNCRFELVCWDAFDVQRQRRQKTERMKHSIETKIYIYIYIFNIIIWYIMQYNII